MEQLVREHGNVARLLFVLEAQLELLSAGESCDVELASEVLQYLVDFTNQFLHPREKLASRHVADRFPNARPALDAIARQHAEIDDRSAALLSALEETRLATPAARREFAVAGWAYVRLLRAHMLDEETSLFPLVTRGVSADEWAAIVAAVGTGDDPLWGKTVHARYAALYEQLTKNAGCECAYD